MLREFGVYPRLERVDVPAEAGDLPVPRYVDCFIRDASESAEALEGTGDGRFVPGDHRYAFQVLQWLLRTQAVPKGAAFLEWGSGQGMVTILAGLLGFEAQGVELDEKLVAEARTLAERYDARVRFLHGSYDTRTPDLKVYTAAKRALVYVYPWPGEEAFFLQLFESSAPEGAHLLMGLGPEDIRVYRKS